MPLSALSSLDREATQLSIDLGELPRPGVGASLIVRTSDGFIYAEAECSLQPKENVKHKE